MGMFDYQALNKSNAANKDPKLAGNYGGGGQPKGTPDFVSQGFNETAGFIEKGSQMAEGDIRSAFEDLYRHKASGIAGGFGDQQRRIGAEASSQGLSPDFAKRMQFEGQARTHSAIGEARGGALGEMGLELAGLHKGTGTELALLKRDETDSLMENYLQSKSRKASRKASKMRFLASVFSTIGQAAGAAAGASAGGASGGQNAIADTGGGMY
jgi:hypothetical protein